MVEVTVIVLALAFSLLFGASFPGWIALHWAATQEFGPPRWRQIMQVVSFQSHSQILPTISASLPCSCTISLQCLSFFRCSASFSSPPGHHRLDCFWYTTKISVEGPIRQTWPNKHHSCCQLGDSPLQLSLQVALTYSLDKTSGSRERRFPPPGATHTCQPDGHDSFLLLTR
jgi:hypothetical protein